MAIKKSEYQCGVLAALNEAKTLALAHATLAGVLAGAEVANTLLISFNALLDPLIEKHSQGLDHAKPSQGKGTNATIYAVVERVISVNRVERGCLRVDVQAMDVETGVRFNYSRTFSSGRSARKFRPGTPFIISAPPAGGFDNGVPF